MIAYLKGIITYKSPEFVTIDIGGIGYRVFISLNTFYSLPDINEEVFLYIHTYLREDTIHLYGFISKEEREIFLNLIAISGIGPRLAINILSGIGPKEFERAIYENNIKKIQKIPGIGRKTAERILLEMKHKMKLRKSPDIEKEELFDNSGESIYSLAYSALINLGYKPFEAEKAIATAKKRISGNVSLEELLKESLKVMA